MTDKYFSVRNFDRFQHYKDRSPPWIKLYNSTLDDYPFTCLPDASRLHLISIWLLASRLLNKIPYDVEWISKAIKATSTVDLELLERAGFIVVTEEVAGAGKPRNRRKRDASVLLVQRRERDREETEKNKTPSDEVQIAFEQWYATFPRKQGRGQALRAFKVALGKASLDDLLSGVERYQKAKPAYADWCMPATWLNGERWLDESPKAGQESGYDPAKPRNLNQIAG